VSITVPNSSSDEDRIPDEDESFAYEGFWARLRCEGCGDVSDVEGDVTSGEIMECEMCGREGRVYGR
jgi:hypothetical protein